MSTGAKPHASADLSATAQAAANPAAGASAADSVLLSIVGTNDIHGALDRLPMFAGYVANLRARRATAGKDAGGVVLIDAGDMFQGTIESNINEGAAVIDAMNALGYTASVVGNHEFDFGPVGPKVSAREPGDDPRGALYARFAQASFPILAGNYLDARSGQRVDWPGAPAAILREVAGVKIGVVGVSTFSTPSVTLAANVADLKMAALTETIEREARDLRARGAQVVVATAHAGGKCKNLQNPDDIASCVPEDEIMRVARALPAGLVDVIVGGHTHRAMAHRVNGIAIIESYSSMRAFGRVDMRVNTSVQGQGAAEVVAIFPPRDICPGKKRVPVAECQPGEYEGAPVRPDARLQAIIDPALQAAEVRKRESLNVTLSGPLTRSYGKHSTLGNFVADLMREANPTDIAITNGGGLRANLPAGPLTYGALYETTPFDNRFATMTLTVDQLARAVASNLQHTGGVLSISGAHARAECQGDTLRVTISDERGRPMDPTRTVTVNTSDYLATIEKGPFGRLGLPAGAIKLDENGTIRDAMAEVLRRRGGTIDVADPALFDPSRPRLEYSGRRPLKCPTS